MKYPITPEYLQTAPDRLVSLYETLEETILKDICRRFKWSGTATDSAIEQIKNLKRRGLSVDKIEKAISETVGLSEKELDKLFDEAIDRNERYYKDVLTKERLLEANYSPDAMASEIEAIRKQTKGELVNITQSLGFATKVNGVIQFLSAAEMYQKILDDAELEVWSGAIDYNTAIKSAVKKLADSGLQRIDYASGWHNRVDVAARRAIMTGITQVSRQYSEETAHILQTPYREVTAHIGARDVPGPSPWSSHKAWQGKVYSVNSGDKYPNIYTVCGLGFVDGLTGANCRHLYYPFVEGVSERTWTDEQLENIDPPPFTYQGKQYTAYEATQKQRQIETAIRKAKRDVLAYKESGLDVEYTDASVKLRRLTSEYKAFSNAARLRLQPERANVLGFGKSQSARSIAAAKSHESVLQSFSERMTNLGYKLEGFKNYSGDIRTIDRMQSAFVNLSSKYPESINGLTIKLSRENSRDDFGWYDDKTNTMSFNKTLFRDWDVATKEYNKSVKEGLFPVGTTADGCFYHEFGHHLWNVSGRFNIKKKIDKTIKDLGHGYVGSGKRNDLLKKILSTYSISETYPEYQEVIAECMNEWYTSNNPREFCKAFLKEVGFIGDV